MLSAGNHLEETDPWNEPYCCKHNKPPCLDNVALFHSAHNLILAHTAQTTLSNVRITGKQGTEKDVQIVE
jgi:hypothetical protein